MQQPQLEIRELSTPQLKPLSLSLNSGEIVSLRGASGAGKSLLLRSICDLIEHQGELLLNGVSNLKFPAHLWRRSVGMLAAESFWWQEQIGDHFTDASDISRPLSQLGLPLSILDQEVSLCSTGERQRLALIRLLQNRPPVLLLDEPTSGLDPAAALKVEALICSYVTSEQASVIWVSHDNQQCRRVASRHLLMVNGTLTEEQP
jgi:putative ABC transport system ATP-binding protein